MNDPAFPQFVSDLNNGITSTERSGAANGDGGIIQEIGQFIVTLANQDPQFCQQRLQFRINTVEQMGIGGPITNFKGVFTSYIQGLSPCSAN